MRYMLLRLSINMNVFCDGFLLFFVFCNSNANDEAIYLCP